MWDNDWALLGLEPTSDLAAIKKAYALKLKVTRPDDDAAAYQALREAYGRAQDWARWQASEVASPDAQADVSMLEPAAVVALAPRDDETPPAPSDPQDLVGALEAAWSTGGEAQLLAIWPVVHAQLMDLPLRAQPQASALFAQWVVANDGLPAYLLRALAAHFGWLGDYRSTRELGPELTATLEQVLMARLPPPVSDPRLLAFAEPLQALNTELQQGSQRRARWLAMLSVHLFAEQLRALSGETWARLGLDGLSQARLLNTLTWGRRARWAITLLGFALVAYLMTGDWVMALGPTAFLAVAVWAWFWMGAMVGNLFTRGLSLTRAGRAPPPTEQLPRLRRWRQHAAQPLAGMAVLLAACGLAATDLPAVLGLQGAGHELAVFAVLTVGLAGVLLAWPLDEVHGLVIAGLSPLVCALFIEWQGRRLGVEAAAMLGVLWMLVGAAASEGRVRLKGVLEWSFRPVLNSLALAQRWGYPFAMLPAFCALAPVVLADPIQVSPSSMFLIWVLGNLVAGFAQRKIDDWVLARLLPAKPE